jgi:NAD(P)-dependent dehydrogenase (short-subunit alcohol dehydrogenase family)
MDLALAGKTALVTGGGRGIGRGIAIALAEEGTDVVIAGRHPESRTVDELRALGVRADAIEVDVGSEAGADSMVAQAIGLLGVLDLYVNNAGGHWHEAVTKLTVENVTRTMETNLYAAMWAARAAARHMIDRRAGAILMVGSTIAFNPGYQEAAYRASKAGLRAFAETMALELGPYGIRVNVLTPGLMRTRLAAGLDEAFADDEIGPPLRRALPLRRIGEPEECGPAAAFLLSDKVASYITGAELIVDGGFHLRPLTLVTERQVTEMND